MAWSCTSCKTANSDLIYVCRVCGFSKDGTPPKEVKTVAKTKKRGGKKC